MATKTNLYHHRKAASRRATLGRALLRHFKKKLDLMMSAATPGYAMAMRRHGFYESQ